MRVETQTADHPYQDAATVVRLRCELVDYYAVLGLPRNAQPEEVRHAYLAKALQLRPEHFPGASEELLHALAGAAVTINDAWHVLGDPDRRAEYDRGMPASSYAAPKPKRLSAREVIAEHVWAIERELGWHLSEVLGLEPVPPGPAPVPVAQPTAPSGGTAGEVPPEPVSSINPSSRWGWEPLDAPFAVLEAVANWLGPHEHPSREVVVPNVCGLRASEVFYAVAKAQFHIQFVPLNEHPDGDGLVVGQDPPAGSRARRQSTLIVQVVYALSSSR